MRRDSASWRKGTRKVTGSTEGESIEARGVFSTIAMTVFGSAVGGFFWIGRPGLALLTLPAALALLAVAAWYGFPSLNVGDTGIDGLALIALVLLQVGAVLHFLKSSRPKGWHSRWYFALLLAFVISAIPIQLIRSFLVQPFRSASDSMVPTLVEGDTFFVSKWAYGYSKRNFPLELIDFEGRKFVKLPLRGDVVTLRTEGGLDYVKRIVGMPGEKIKLIDGNIIIDGKPVQREDKGPYVSANTAPDARIFRETLPNGIQFDTLELDPQSTLDNTREYLVPEGQYFVLGDNRDNSNDSRLDLGFIPLENLIGRVERIYWNSEGTPYAERQVVRPQRQLPAGG